MATRLKGLMGMGIGALLLAGSTAFGQSSDSMFKQGSQSLYLGGTHGTPIFSDEQTYYSANAAYGYFFVDRFSINPQLSGHWIDANQETDVLGVDYSILLRWHFIEYKKLSVFIDAGPGVAYFDHGFPGVDDENSKGGTHFNFFLQGGLGATYELREHLHLLGAVRWTHVSNGGLQGADRHPGSDALAFSVGLLWTF